MTLAAVGHRLVGSPMGEKIRQDWYRAAPTVAQSGDSWSLATGPESYANRMTSSSTRRSPANPTPAADGIGPVPNCRGPRGIARRFKYERTAAPGAETRLHLLRIGGDFCQCHTKKGARRAATLAVMATVTQRPLHRAAGGRT